jgi:hypothetical protein
VRRFQESFDGFSVAQMVRKWTWAPGSYIDLAAAYGRNGNGMRIWNCSNPPYMILDAHQKWTCGFAWKKIGLDFMLCGFRDATSLQVELRVDAVGHLYVTRNGTQIGGTSSYTVPEASWVYVEFQAFIHDTAGYFEVRVNGVCVLSGTNLDTKNTANAWADGFIFGNPGSKEAHYDDFYLNDDAGSAHNGFDGDQKVIAYVANANGSQNGWTPSTGADRYAVIDEKPANDDTDYIYSPTVDDIFSCAFEDFALVGVISAVQVLALARKDDAGSRSIQIVSRVGGVNYFSPSVSIGNSYLYYRQIQETNPNTGSPWAPGDFNAAEFGAKVIS